MGFHRRNDAGEHLTGGPIKADRVVLAYHLSVDGELAPLRVHHDGLRTGHTRLAQAPRDHGGMACGAAARGQNALGDEHPMHVVGVRFRPHQDDRFTSAAQFGGAVSVEDGLAGGRARRGIQAGGEPAAGGRSLGLGVSIEVWEEELVDLVRLDPLDRFLLADESFLGHVYGDLHGGGGGPLGGAGLEHVQRSALDGELQVLRIAIVLLQTVGNGLELPVHRGHIAGQLRDGLRGTNAGDDILALRVRQELAEEPLLPGRRVAGEGHPRPRILAHVAEHHRHDVDGRAQIVGYLVEITVGIGPRIVPGGEYRFYRLPQLLIRIVRELLPRLLAHKRLEALDHVYQLVGREVGILCRAHLLLDLIEQLLKVLAGHAGHDLAEHLDKPAVGVVGKALVARQLRQALERLGVQAEVEHRIHHAGHRELGPGTYRDEQGVVGIAELLAGCGLDFLHRGERLIPQFRGKLLTGSVVGVAGFRRDREARRHRQLGVRHFRKASAFAPQKIAHLRIAVREAIHPFCRRRRTHRVSVLLPYPKCDRLHRAGATPARNHSIILPAGISCKNSASHPPRYR